MGILNKAFCCCQLTTAAVLLGWLGAVGYFMVLTSILISVTSGYFFEADDFMDVLRIVMILSTMLLSTVNLIGCGCLMVGSIKKIRLFILPWLIGEIIFIIIVTFFCGTFLFEATIRQRRYMISECIFSLMFLIFQIYVWFCVYSLFQELREIDIKKLGVESKKSTTLKDDAQPYSSFA